MKSTTTNLGEGTTLHCWIPKNPNHSNPNLLLLHGFGANSMWQWDHYINPLKSQFNLYVPDLIFFDESYTTRPERSESFQARSVMRLMDEKFGVKRMHVAGVSYGGFVAYSMAAQFPEVVDKVVLCDAGVSMDAKDLEDGLFKVSSLDEAVRILVPESPEKLRELIRLAFYKHFFPVPSCFLGDYIHVMTTYVEGKRELIEALYKDADFANLPKISQSMLIIWGEEDQIFPIELAYRLQRYLDDTPQLVIIKEAGHAANLEKPGQLVKHMKNFLLDSNSNGTKNSGHHADANNADATNGR